MSLNRWSTSTRTKNVGGTMNFRINHWVRSLALLALLVGVFFAYTAHPAPAIAAGPEAYNVYAPFGCVPGVDCNVVGSGQLVRSAQGVSMSIQTTGLDQAAYTVWWIVFNSPANCSDGVCGEDDIFIFDDDGNIVGPNVPGREAAEISVLRAAGNVVGAAGRTGFAGHLQAGNTKGQELFGPGLTNVEGAEIHLVVRSHDKALHGPDYPGMVQEQISTVGGGCGVDGNVCEDQQFALPN